MLLDKKGDWDNSHGSWWYFIGGLIFLYIGLMPFFDIFPFSFTIGESLLRVFLALLGVLILVESFTMDPMNKFGKVVVGLIFAIVGVYSFLSYQGVSWLPFEMALNSIVLQILLIIYAIYLFIGAWRQ